MKIKFKNLNKIYLIAAIVAPMCILIQIYGEYSEALKTVGLTIIILFGIFGFLLAILKKVKIIHIYYSEKDKKSIFYKIINFAEKINN